MGSLTRFSVSSRAIPERIKMWRHFKTLGVTITSRWVELDEQNYQAVCWDSIWCHVVREIAESDMLVFYAKKEDFPLRGAFVEVGIALAFNKPVTVCIPGVDLQSYSARPLGRWVYHPLVSRNDNINKVFGL